MANVIPSFLSSAKLVIKIDGRVIAYATNLSISDRMAVAPVGGIGAYNADALEPLQYSVSGSFAITIYDEGTLTTLNHAGGDSKKLTPARATQAASRNDLDSASSGNSMFTQNFFSPVHLMTSRSIDIEVHERLSGRPEIKADPKAKPEIKGSPATEYETVMTYFIEGARLTSYSLTFTPGSLMQEQVGFIALQMTDKMASALTIPTKA